LDSRTAPGPFIPPGSARLGAGHGSAEVLWDTPGSARLGAGHGSAEVLEDTPASAPLWAGRGSAEVLEDTPGFRPFDCGGVCSGVAGCRLGAVLSVCGLTQPLRFAIPSRLVMSSGLPAPVAALGDKSDLLASGFDYKSDLLASGFDYKSDLLTSGFDYKPDELKRIRGNIRRNV
ncbi:hypothetical protein, partial [Schaalia sp.]|uniref:hypothetical protein n=1 Tax=Schaalia sp. TaxID=2691890 RepID=UPI003D0D1D5A